MLSKNLEQLFCKWEAEVHHVGKCFVKDGIIDDRCWQNAPRKVCFVLREAYWAGASQPPEAFDLCQIIREWKGPKWRTWWAVANWAYAAHQGTATVIPSLSFESRPRRRTSLLASAVVNVKKSNGGKSSNREEIAEYARKDHHFIRDQMDFIDPELVICGGTWEAIRPIWHSEATQVSEAAFRVGRRLFIQFRHPARSTKADYQKLACLLQNAGYLPYSAP